MLHNRMLSVDQGSAVTAAERHQKDIKRRSDSIKLLNVAEDDDEDDQVTSTHSPLLIWSYTSSIFVFFFCFFLFLFFPFLVFNFPPHFRFVPLSSQSPSHFPSPHFPSPRSHFSPYLGTSSQRCFLAPMFLWDIYPHRIPLTPPPTGEPQAIPPRAQNGARGVPRESRKRRKRRTWRTRR